MCDTVANLCFSLQDAGVPIERDAPVPCLRREYPLISRGIIWCCVSCSALPRLLVDLGKMTPHSSLLKGKTQTMLVTGLQGQELPHCSHVSASPHCSQSWWLSLSWCLARCPRHRWLQEQPPSAVPSVLLETLRVFLLGAPRAAWRVSQSPESVLAGTAREGVLGKGTQQDRVCWGRGQPDRSWF